MSEWSAAPLSELPPARTVPPHLDLLNAQLRVADIEAEFYFLSGAVISQAFNANPSTAHVSQLFRPTRAVTEAAERVRRREGLGPEWLNRTLAEHLGPPGASSRYVELSHLRAFVPCPQYALAVKCAAMCLGGAFDGHEDVRYLLRGLNITTVEAALEIVTRYFGARQLVPDASSHLERLLGG